MLRRKGDEFLLRRHVAAQGNQLSRGAFKAQGIASRGKAQEIHGVTSE
jgi:hypothetical protein